MPLPDPWFSIGDAVVRAQTVADYAAICDTIDRDGIWELDEFNRPVPRDAESEAARWAKGYALEVMRYERDGPKPGGEDAEGPLDTLGDQSDVTWKYGWPEKEPEFEQSVHAPKASRSQSIAAQSKRIDSQLLVIAALLKMLGKTHDSRGVAAVISKQVSNIDGRITIDEGTVRGILGSIPDAMGRRSR